MEASVDSKQIIAETPLCTASPVSHLMRRCVVMGVLSDGSLASCPTFARTAAKCVGWWCGRGLHHLEVLSHLFTFRCRSLGHGVCCPCSDPGCSGKLRCRVMWVVVWPRFRLCCSFLSAFLCTRFSFVALFSADRVLAKQKEGPPQACLLFPLFSSRREAWQAREGFPHAPDEAGR